MDGIRGWGQEMTLGCILSLLPGQTEEAYGQSGLIVSRPNEATAALLWGRVEASHSGVEQQQPPKRELDAVQAQQPASSNASEDCSEKQELLCCKSIHMACRS